LLFFAPQGVRIIAISLSICLSVRVFQRRTSKLGETLTVARTFFGDSVIFTRLSLSHHVFSWASAHGKWGQLTPPGKMDEKLKSENMQKKQFSMFMLYFESNQGRQGRQRYADNIFIQIYLRMRHFVVKFSKFSSP